MKIIRAVFVTATGGEPTYELSNVDPSDERIQEFVGKNWKTWSDLCNGQLKQQHAESGLKKPLFKGLETRSVKAYALKNECRERKSEKRNPFLERTDFSFSSTAYGNAIFVFEFKE